MCVGVCTSPETACFSQGQQRQCSEELGRKGTAFWACVPAHVHQGASGVQSLFPVRACVCACVRASLLKPYLCMPHTSMNVVCLCFSFFWTHQTVQPINFEASAFIWSYITLLSQQDWTANSLEINKRQDFTLKSENKHFLTKTSSCTTAFSWHQMNPNVYICRYLFICI